MKRLLNNPWVVGVLGLCAIIVLIHNVLRFFPDKSEDFVDAPTDADIYDWLEPDVVADSENELIGNTILQGISSNQLFWDESPSRDPFSAHIFINNSDLSAVQGQALTNLGDIVFRQPILSALVAGKASKLAVINGEVVREGDNIAGLTVSRIASTGVWVSVAAQHYKLELPGYENNDIEKSDMDVTDSCIDTGLC